MPLALALLAAFATVPAEPERGACTAGGPRVMVTVRGLKNEGGALRVQIYDESGFLKKGRWLGRIETVAREGQTVCIAAPAPGRYAIAVRHDANRNGKSDWNDGGGFSRNPRLSLLNLKPDFASAVIEVGAGVTPVSVTMNYRRGLSVGPAS